MLAKRETARGSFIAGRFLRHFRASNKQANPLVTPVHIRPEWYFLFAYAILRSIPNKLGGVLALFASILIFFLLPVLHKSLLRGLTFRPLGQVAAKKAVKAPTTVVTVNAKGEPSKRGPDRIIRKTPAVTIVAA